jgi:hypothetical protein
VGESLFMLGEKLMETSDASKIEALKRLMQNEICKHKSVQDQLDFDLLTIGHCAYNITDDGELEYVDPLSPEVLNHLNKK